MPFKAKSAGQVTLCRRTIPVMIAVVAAHFLVRYTLHTTTPSQPVALLMASLPPLFCYSCTC